LEDYGLAYIIIAFVEVALVSLIPVVVGTGYVVETIGVLMGITAILCFIAFKTGSIHKPLAKNQ